MARMMTPLKLTEFGKPVDALHTALIVLCSFQSPLKV